MERVTTAAALALLPAAVSATVPPATVSVEVHVVGGVALDSKSWVEFRPDRGAYVALYAMFSDGSMESVFPVAPGLSHWVNAGETRAVPVTVPRGLCLTDVQAVAATEWFDPAEGWVASAPVPGHRVVLAGAGHPQHPAWGFVVGWSGSHSDEHVRSWERSERKPGGTMIVSASGAVSSIRGGASGELQPRSGR